MRYVVGIFCGEIKPQIAVASCKLHPTTSVKSAIHINLLSSWKNSIKSIFTLLPRSDFEWKSLCLPSSLHFVCCARQWSNRRRRRFWGEQTCLLSAKTRRTKAMSHQQQLYHEFGVTLQRQRKDEQWGLRLAGGSDLNSPLIVIRVISLSFFTHFWLKRAIRVRRTFLCQRNWTWLRWQFSSFTCTKIK